MFEAEFFSFYDFPSIIAIEGGDYNNCSIVKNDKYLCQIGNNEPLGRLLELELFHKNFLYSHKNTTYTNSK